MGVLTLCSEPWGVQYFHHSVGYGLGEIGSSYYGTVSSAALAGLDSFHTDDLNAPLPAYEVQPFYGFMLFYEESP